MKTLAEFTDRQRFALTHSTDRSRGPMVFPHQGVSKKIGAWLTVLEVACEDRIGWLWVSSVSRHPYLLRQWEPAWHDEAEALFSELIGDVGGDVYDHITKVRAAGIDPEGMVSAQRWKLLTDDEVALVLALRRGPQ